MSCQCQTTKLLSKCQSKNISRKNICKNDPQDDEGEYPQDDEWEYPQDDENPQNYLYPQDDEQIIRRRP